MKDRVTRALFLSVVFLGILLLIPACGELPVIIIPVPNTPPSVAITDPTGTQTGIIAVAYTLTDGQSHSVTIVVEWSLDGMMWHPATRSGGQGTTGLSSSLLGTAHTFNWDSAVDGVGKTMVENTVSVRITPSDADAGMLVESGTFMVDNSVTAFRMTSLYQRDPHTWISSTFPPIPCSDIQDVFSPPQTISPYGSISGGLNELTNKVITTDGSGDGFLDSAPLLLFRRFDPSTTTGVLEFAAGHCNAAGTSSDLLAGSTRTSTTLTNSTGTLLSPGAGTTNSGYTPTLTAVTGTGFVTAPVHYDMNLGSVVLPLDEYQIAALYSPTPPSAPVALASGLAKGFLPESVANTIFITISGVSNPLSAFLTGGGGCGTVSDKDTGPGGALGWWFYFQFTATLVTYTGP